MKFIHRLFVMMMALGMALPGSAQEPGKRFTLEDFTLTGRFYPRGVQGIRSLADGEHYTALSGGGSMLVKYSYRTGKAVDTLLNLADPQYRAVQRIQGYEFSADESRVLICTNVRPIYRRSFTAEYYVYDMKNRELKPLSTGGPQRLATFSPTGTKVAFMRDNNLFIADLRFGSELQITSDGKVNEIINGAPDWVYEEEFGYNRAFEWAPDGSALAYVKFDERAVREYEMNMFKGLAPAMEENAVYPSNYIYKYPKAGERNSTVSVHVYDLKDRITTPMNVGEETDIYIPRIRWTQDPKRLAIMTLNRHQNRFNVYMANPRSALCKTVIRDEAEQYIKEQAYSDIVFYPENIVMMSERDGYNHLYLYSIGGNLIKQITSGKFEVKEFLGWDQKTNVFYYTSNEESPLRSAVYKVDGKGKKTKLSTRVGTNNALFSKNFAYYINTYSSKDTPTLITLNNNKGKEMATLMDNAELKSKVANLNMPTKEFFTFKTPDGVELNGWMMKPAHFDPNKKYPVIMHQYSGPGSQQVLDRWGIGSFGDGGMFEAYMCDKGYIMVCVDGRGTGGRGAAFEKCTYLFLGVKESKDQAAAAHYLSTLPYIDGTRIGIWGWSFGGYNTLMSMSEGSGAFKAGVAIAAPTDWRFYDSVYTERFMRTPKENGEGYDAGSPIKQAAKLQGKLLLIHGTADDNVHFQNCAEYSEALVQANKQFDMQVYTNRNHGISGGNTRNHLMNRVADFFIENL